VRVYACPNSRARGMMHPGHCELLPAGAEGARGLRRGGGLFVSCFAYGCLWSVQRARQAAACSFKGKTPRLSEVLT
jgi:hypothetical protein